MEEVSLRDLIRQKREAKGWSQRHLAEEVGVNERTIQRHESGKTIPSPYALRKIAKELGITEEELKNVNTRGGIKEVEPDPSPQPPPIPPPVPPKRRWQPNWLVLCLTAITIAIVVTSSVVFWALIGKNIYNTISGEAVCPDNQPISGVYIKPINGGGSMVTLQFQNSNESMAKFQYTLPDGGAYYVHAGCGIKPGPAGGWAKTYRTEDCSGSVEDRAFHVFTIYNRLPADRSKPCLVRYGQ